MQCSAQHLEQLRGAAGTAAAGSGKEENTLTDGR